MKMTAKLWLSVGWLTLAIAACSLVVMSSL